jgi:mRNA interferase RelE/StbE
MAYRIDYRPRAKKHLANLPKNDGTRIYARIGGLAKEPRPQGVKKLEGGESLYRIQIGDYRVVYYIDDKASTITITRIRHRRDAYRNF